MSLLSWCGFDLVGKTFGEDNCVPEVGDPPDFQPSILVDGGIAYVSFFKKLLIPSYARIENVKKGCYRTIDPKQEKCEKKKERYCERRCRRRERKKQMAACLTESNIGINDKPKIVAVPEEPKQQPEEERCHVKPQRPSERSSRLDPKLRCSLYNKDK